MTSKKNLIVLITTMLKAAKRQNRTLDEKVNIEACATVNSSMPDGSAGKTVNIRIRIIVMMAA